MYGDFLKIVDRKKDIIITRVVKMFLIRIENNIKISPAIKEAMIGDEENFYLL